MRLQLCIVISKEPQLILRLDFTGIIVYFSEHGEFDEDVWNFPFLCSYHKIS